jgi:hypothetical protein
MPWTIRILETLGIVETTFSGVCGPEAVEEGARASIAAANENDMHRFLADCTELDTGASPLELYKLTELYKRLPLPINTVEAVLIPKNPDAAEGMGLYETMSLNRGVRVRIFDDREKAIKWLSADGPQ